MTPLEPVLFPVRLGSDVPVAGRAAVEHARSAGFDQTVAAELRLVATELAANIVQHAGRGEIRLAILEDGGRTGLEIRSNDHGPGIGDVGQALTDGYSTNNSLGCGLGAADRLSDELTIHSPRASGTGTTIVCRRWVMDTPRLEQTGLDIAAATRHHPGMDVNGDAYVIAHWPTGALAGVIDGVGHGRPAAQASKNARCYIQQNCKRSVQDLFRGVAHCCRATRGVVMALVKFDWSSGKMTVGSVGNVEVRCKGWREKPRLALRRGILGARAPEPMVTEHEWNPGAVVVLHSDGIRANWSWQEFPEMERQPACRTARDMLAELIGTRDDATVLVVKGGNR